MKRFFAVLIALLHLAATTGATVYVHHCMGKEIGTSISAISGEDGHFCSHCGMQNKKGGNGCCKDELRIVKSDVDGTLAKTAIAQLTAPALLPSADVFPASLVPRIVSAPPAKAVWLYSPPPQSGVPVYLAIRNLRI